MVVLRKMNGKAEIDVVGTAGGTGWLSLSWWSESGFTNSLVRHFANECEFKRWSFEEIA